MLSVVVNQKIACGPLKSAEFYVRNWLSRQKLIRPGQKRKELVSRLDLPVHMRKASIALLQDCLSDALDLEAHIGDFDPKCAGWVEPTPVVDGALQATVRSDRMGTTMEDYHTMVRNQHRPQTHGRWAEPRVRPTKDELENPEGRDRPGRLVRLRGHTQPSQQPGGEYISQ